jgi:WD40 repeat protein
LAVLAVLLAGCAVAPREPAAVVIPNAHGGGSALAFHPDGKLLASGGWEGNLRLWRVPEGAPLASWRAHATTVNGIFFLDEGKTILSAGYDGALVLWDAGGHVLKRAQLPQPVTALAVDEGRGLAYTGHADGSVRALRLADFSGADEWRPLTAWIRAVAVEEGSGTIAASGDDGVVLIAPGAAPRKLATPPTASRALRFSADGQTLYGSGWFQLYHWNAAEGTLATLPTEHHGIINSLQFDAGGRYLASISRQTDSAVLFLDPASGATLRRFQKHDLCGGHVALSRDGRFMATDSDDASVRIYSLLPLPDPLPQAGEGD